MNDNVGTRGSCVRSNDNIPPTNGITDDGRTNRASLHARKSPRAEFHNYSGGDYFVTICTREKAHFFGTIHNGEMHLSKIGEYCKQQLEEITIHYSYATTPLFVVMPNHVHAIICVNNNSLPHNDGKRTHGSCVPTERTALSVIIGGLKRAVTMYARRNNVDFGWQSRYHDHIIRGTHDGNKIADYIKNNVARWASDCFYK